MTKNTVLEFTELELQVIEMALYLARPLPASEGGKQEEAGTELIASLDATIEEIINAEIINTLLDKIRLA